jgi:hypothetical protein
MSDAWAKFWLAMALMALAGVIAGSVAWGGKLEVGALAQWVAAGATFGAIWIALHNTQRTLDETNLRESKKQERLDRSYIAAVIAMCCDVLENIAIIKDECGARKRSTEELKELECRTGLGSNTSSLERIPIHASPDSELVLLWINARLAAHNAHTKLSDTIARQKSSTVDVDDELKLIEDTVRRIKRRYGADYAEIIGDFGSSVAL